MKLMACFLFSLVQYVLFFISNAFFNSASVLLNFLMNWASIVPYVLLNTYRHHLTVTFLNLVYLVLCLCQGLFFSYGCDLFFIMIFILIIINLIISLKQTQMFFYTFYFLPVRRSDSGCCLAFAPIFSLMLLIKVLFIKVLCVVNPKPVSI